MYFFCVSIVVDLVSVSLLSRMHGVRNPDRCSLAPFVPVPLVCCKKVRMLIKKKCRIYLEHPGEPNEHVARQVDRGINKACVIA